MHSHLTTFFDGRPHYVIDVAGCWLWQGGLTRAGYGLCSPWTGQRLAHRWYYARYCGPLTAGLHVHHRCGVPQCVNPDHLEALAPAENLSRRQLPRRAHPWAPHTQSVQAASGAAGELEDEEWRPVPGYEGWYSVSARGRVRRDRAGRGARAGHLCKLYHDAKGYLRVALLLESRHKSYAVHRLVAAAFLRAPAPGEQVNHRNCIKDDNRLANLEWVTQHENMAHAKKNGLRPDTHGQRNPRAKLTPRQVQEIRDLRGVMRQIDIAARYGMSQSQVSAIQLGVTWRD